MFSNILYVVEDDSKYLLMDNLLTRNEALSCCFLNRQPPDEVSAESLAGYDLLIVDNEFHDDSSHAGGQALVRKLFHEGASLPVLLISDLDDVALDPETVDWVSEHRMELVSGSPQTEKDLVRAIIRAIERSALDVLVLEESPDEYQVIEYCLRPSKGYRVNTTHVTDTDAAEQQFQKRSFDAYLISHKIGDRNSNELLEELLERWPPRPVILLTNHDTDDLDERLTRLLGRHRFEVLDKQGLNTDKLRKALRRTHIAQRQHPDAEATTEV